MLEKTDTVKLDTHTKSGLPPNYLVIHKTASQQNDKLVNLMSIKKKPISKISATESNNLKTHLINTNTEKSQGFYSQYGVAYVTDVDFLANRYHIGRKLGDGNFAVVKMGRSRESNKQCAIKIIEKSKLKGKEIMLANEIKILQSCNHPNIVKLYEQFETLNEIWIIMEYVKDGDLFDNIIKATKFSEMIASKIVSNLANALFYLHCRSIVHRDLKPENVLLLYQKNGELQAKLGDFGLALKVKRSLYTVCGTPTYIAPEILQECGYGIEVDLWALGIITYIMLCGFAPFRSVDRKQSKLFESIKRGDFIYLSPYWDEISSGAKDFINRLLVTKPQSRLTALDSIIHPWVFGCGNTTLTNKAEQRRIELYAQLQSRCNLGDKQDPLFVENCQHSKSLLNIQNYYIPQTVSLVNNS